MLERSEGRGKIPEEETEVKDLEDDLKWVNSFEDLLEVVGTSGRWNALNFTLCSLSVLLSPLHLLSYQFLGATPDHWCHIAPLEEANWTQEQILTLAVPYRNATSEYDGCHMYGYNYTAAVEVGYEASVSNVSLLGLRGDNATLVKCSSRTFNYTQYQSTIVTEWDLVCEHRVIYSSTQAVTQGGAIIGSLVFGFLVDTWGRRPVLLLCSVLQIVASFLNAASPTVEVYIIIRVIISFLSSGLYISSFVYAMETCATHHREALCTLLAMPWALSLLLLAGIAYLVRSWRCLQITLSSPAILTIVFYWWVPESPRWLIIQGHRQEALGVVSWAAKINRNTLPPDHHVLAAMNRIGRRFSSKESLEAGKIQKETKSNFFRVISTLRHVFVLYTIPKLRVRALVMVFCWFAVGAVYYGVTLGATNLRIDLYLYMLLGGLVEIPSYLLLWPALIFVGRRKFLVVLYLVCGLSIILVLSFMVVSAVEGKGVVVFLAQTGKIAVTAAYQLIWVYAAELFPTEYRSLALGMGNTLARIGGACSPYINDVLGQYFLWAPSALFGLLSLVAAALTLLLPETSRCVMPESSDFVKEGEEDGATDDESERRLCPSSSTP
ncbi:organic cation transporter protein-like [Panulirus ornatus]|uniref:organic cation transporter protein-like n=1 Tax=Panulirus ornatus TaxID=150431 RepID=UPI003A8353A2